MAPGALSILAPFLGRKSNKKYEKLQADDPEKRRQEATQEEINRLNTKIVSMMNFAVFFQFLDHLLRIMPHTYQTYQVKIIQIIKRPFI